MSSLKEVKFHRFISSHSLDKIVGTWSEMSIYSWSSQCTIPKSIELVLLTLLYFPFCFALNHFKCYRLSILIMQNVKMGKWAHLLTSLATVNVHHLSWHLHFHLINTPPSPHIYPSERGRNSNILSGTLFICALSFAEKFFFYPVTSNKQSHTYGEIFVPTFFDKEQKNSRSHRLERKSKAVMYANSIPWCIFLGVYWLTCLSV